MVQIATPLKEYARQLRVEIDAKLAEYLRLDQRCPAALRESMRYSVLAEGKRLRPVLVLMAAEACGAEHGRALPAACAVEMIHAYSLIHDDLPAMDNDDLRRGQPTNHKKFGEALAILAGDGLLTLAFEVLARDIQPPATAAACCATLAEAAGVCGMVGGQADDIDEGRAVNLDTLESIHRRKTGALLQASLRLGALVAGADAAQRNALDHYGRHLGMAFQIVDDLLDVQGDEQAVGKRLHKDSDQGKLTFPRLLGVEESRRRAAALIDQACQALAPLAQRGDRLRQLARFVFERDR